MKDGCKTGFCKDAKREALHDHFGISTGTSAPPEVGLLDLTFLQLNPMLQTLNKLMQLINLGELSVDVLLKLRIQMLSL